MTRRLKSEPTLGHEAALIAIEAIRQELARRNLVAVIAVVDAHGELIGLLRLHGSLLSSVQVASHKAYTAARLRRPSREVGEALRDPTRVYDTAYYGDPRYVGWAGGMPVVIGAEVVGAVGVSGQPEAIDEELAILGVAAIVASLNV
jgi:glc operon protein GlcG